MNLLDTVVVLSVFVQSQRMWNDILTHRYHLYLWADNGCKVGLVSTKYCMGLSYWRCRGKSSGEGLFAGLIWGKGSQTKVGFSKMMDAVLFLDVVDEVKFAGTGYGRYSITNAQFAINLTRVEFDGTQSQN